MTALVNVEVLVVLVVGMSVISRLVIVVMLSLRDDALHPDAVIRSVSMYVVGAGLFPVVAPGLWAP